jgi:hypothetical protein
VNNNDGRVRSTRIQELAEFWDGEVVATDTSRSQRALLAAGVRADFALVGLVSTFGTEVLIRAPKRAIQCPHPAAVRVFDGHHVLQQSEGGPSCPENVWPICPNCHRNAHDLYRAWDRAGGVPDLAELRGTPLNQRFIVKLATRRWEAKTGVILPCSALA